MVINPVFERVKTWTWSTLPTLATDRVWFGILIIRENLDRENQGIKWDPKDLHSERKQYFLYEMPSICFYWCLKLKETKVLAIVYKSHTINVFVMRSRSMTLLEPLFPFLFNSLLDSIHKEKQFTIKNTQLLQSLNRRTTYFVLY